MKPGDPLDYFDGDGSHSGIVGAVLGNGRIDVHLTDGRTVTDVPSESDKREGLGYFVRRVLEEVADVAIDAVVGAVERRKPGRPKKSE